MDAQNRQGYQWEQDGFFLVQLPTRLPPLESSNTKQTAEPDDDAVTPFEITSESQTQQEALGGATEGGLPLIAEVVTPPVIANSFDNSLANASPGRLGKIIVYKSGRTVFVMQGSDGTQEVGGADGPW